ncbi:MAG: DNA-binding protein [Alphaproteobacteria bacterium]|nr:DNA-binding protein [Alphaproteobacteria bacterium]
MESIRQLNHVLSEMKNQLKQIELVLQNPIKPDCGWLDHQDVCRRLKISKRTLDHYREMGFLPYSKLGGKVYYRESDLNEYLEKHIRIKKSRSHRI